MADDAIVPGIAGPVAAIVPVAADGTLTLPGGLRLPARPMVGVIGVAPAEGELSTAFPGAVGGNLDCNLIRPGARVHLPVHVPGALLALGDVHASMGDGEISGTGIEINAEVTARVEIGPGAAPARPWIEGDGLIAATASAPSLPEAVGLATEGLIALLTARHGVSRTEAFMLITARGDIRIGQACNPQEFPPTVYACFPDLYADRLRQEEQARRIRTLLDEMERERGPVPEDIQAEVNALDWPK